VAAVALALRSVVKVLLPIGHTLSSLEKLPANSKVREFFRDNPVYMPRQESFEELAGARAKADTDQNEAITAYDHARSANGREEAERRGKKAAARLDELDEEIEDVLAIADYVETTEGFRGSLLVVTICAAVVAAGITAFAWAANPDTPDQPAASLRGTQLNGASMTGVNLKNADLTGASAVGTDFEGANLSGAKISSVKWDGATCPDSTPADTAGNTCAGHLTP
jgi:Pentapeptide repeats (8 copies)